MTINPESGKKLKQARLNKGLNQKKFAEMLCVSPQAVSGWERGVSFPKVDLQDEIAEILDQTKQYLFFDTSKDSGIFFAPFYSDSSDKKLRSEIDKYPLPIKFISEKVSQGSIVCATCTGDSMKPFLTDGAIVAVDKSNKSVVDGDLYLLEINGSLRVKVLSMEISGLRVKSFNKSYDDEIVSIQGMADSSLNIIGKVFWYSSNTN